jgi:hypothetical protein
MRFYQQQHAFYGGVDLHARSMHVCIVAHDGEARVHKPARQAMPPQPAV